MTELTALDQMEQGLFIGGTWSALGGGEAIEVVCPSTEDPVGRVGAASDADVDAAVSAGRDADGGTARRVARRPLRRRDSCRRVSGDREGDHVVGSEAGESSVKPVSKRSSGPR